MNELDNYKDEVELPVLALAIKQNYSCPTHYNFKPNRKWLHICHQTAGYACNHIYLDALLLKPRNKIAIKQIADKYYESLIDQLGKSLDCIIEYRKTLKETLNVDCNWIYNDLQEGIYPIDCTPENLKLLCTDRLPKDLNNLIEWEANHPFAKMLGMLNRWRIFILSENCD